MARSTTHRNNRNNRNVNAFYRPIKPFLTYEGQIDNLINRKNLIINDIPSAISDLESISYFALIDGYKDLFYNTDTRTYVPGTTFDDIRILYDFDDSLRDLYFKYIRIVEQSIRSLVSYNFSETYSTNQSAYLDPANYFPIRNSRADVTKLVNILNYEANESPMHPYVVYQRDTYNNVPLHVLVNALTFGQISRMYSLVAPSIKTKVSRHFSAVSERDLNMYLRVLTNFRNVCAHNERLFSYRDRYDIPDTVLHAKLNISRNGQQYVCGKKDAFSVVISFRYLLNSSDFSSFKRKLSLLITNTVKKSDSLKEAKILKAMGFPENWRNIGRYRL